MKSFNFALTATIVAVFVLLIMFLPFLLQGPVEIKEVENVTTEISDNFMFREERWYYPLKGMVVEMQNDTIPIGVAGQKYELNFGSLPQNSTATKMINFGSEGVAKVEFYSTGNISSMLIVPENFYIKSGESEIKITFNGNHLGNFTGTLLIRNLVPKNFLAEKIIMGI